MDEPSALAVVEGPPPTLYGTADPKEILARATAQANALKEVIDKQGLTTRISGRSHVRVEGWTALGSLLGVFPVTEWTREITDAEGNVIGFKARVEARTRDGAVVGAAESRCMRSERNWKGRDDFAIESMAATRATSKALRLPLGFVMVLAGYEAAPAEEISEPSDPSPSPASQVGTEQDGSEDQPAEEKAADAPGAGEDGSASGQEQPAPASGFPSRSKDGHQHDWVESPNEAAAQRGFQMCSLCGDGRQNK